MTTWTIDSSHSAVNFSVRHLVIAKVRGRFAKFEGHVAFDDATGKPTRVVASIDAASVDTRDDKRDAHLRSADFFDVEKHPKLTFESTSLEARGKDHFVLRGNLSLHGVTKEIALDVTEEGRAKDPWGGERAAFSAKGSLDRKEYGLTWNQALEAGGVLVGEKIDIEIEVEAVKEKAS